MRRVWLLAAALVAPLVPAAAQRGTVQQTPPPAGVLDDLSAYAAQEVAVETADDLTIAGSYFAPRSTRQLAPAVLLIHDTGASRAQLMQLGDRLHKTGFAVLALDLRGHGRSATAELSWDALDEDGRRKLWALAVRDVEAAARWISEREEVHATNLSLVGLRAGAALATRHAARDENVRAVAMLGPSRRELGIDVLGNLQELGGLPTYVASLKDEREDAEALVKEANEANGRPYIELKIASRQADTISGDRRVQKDLADWLEERAFPRKSRK